MQNCVLRNNNITEFKNICTDSIVGTAHLLGRVDLEAILACITKDQASAEYIKILYFSSIKIQANAV